jgi:membrane protease YdiL (CAAX protease family)
LYHATFPLGRAALVTVLAVLAIWIAQVALAAAGTPTIIAVAAAYVLPLGALLVPRAARTRVAIRGAPVRFFIGAALVGASMWILDFALVQLLHRPGDAAPLERVVESAPLLPTILALALAPAIGEELVFRGLLARALGARLGLALAAPISAVAFSLFHVNPIQIVATLPLGVVLAILAIRADSVFPSMLAHACNNVMAILISRDALPRLGEWLFDRPAVAVGAAAVTSAVGIALAARPRPQP